MARTRLELEYDALDPEQRKVALLMAGVSDLRPFWPMVSRLAIGWLGRQFETEGRFFGDGWAPLSFPYLAQKSRLYPGKKILSADGDLRRAATTPERRATAQELVLTIRPYRKRSRAGRANLRLGTARAASGVATRTSGQTIDPDWFQSGTTRMPARPLIGDLPALALAELDQVADEYVTGLARSVGLL